MAKDKMPMTPAVRVLLDQGVDFTPRLYKYVEKGGAAAAARAFDMDEHRVIKTLLFERDDKSPLVVLMHGDREVSTKSLARTVGAKTISACTPQAAGKYTGYMVGGISPFGTRREMPVYVEAAILDLDIIAINGGKRGFLVELSPAALTTVLKAVPVSVAV